MTMDVGDIINGKYRIVSFLGSGGMGTVFEVHHEVLGQRFALKTLHDELAKDEAMVTRFIREAKAAATIGSEHIVYVTDVDQTPDGRPFIVMEHLKGESLSTSLQREGTLSPRKAVALVLQICSAVASAHDEGIVHRDLKPDNIFITVREDGTEWIKILDFGIAKVKPTGGGPSINLTSTGMTLGTPFYMAPEQFRKSKEIDGRADVYSTGVILFQALTGRVPFEADVYEELVIQVATETPPRVDEIRSGLPEELSQIVDCAISRDPDDRYLSMGDFASALSSFSAKKEASRLDDQPQADQIPQTAVQSVERGMRAAVPRTVVSPVSPDASVPETKVDGPRRRGHIGFLLVGIGAIALAVGIIVVTTFDFSEPPLTEEGSTPGASITTPRPYTVYENLLGYMPLLRLVGSPKRGSLVIARWELDDYAFFGRVSKQRAQEYRIHFTDGDSLWVAEHNIVRDTLRSGAVVHVHIQGRDGWLLGTVTLRELTRVRVRLSDDDELVWVPLSMVRIPWSEPEEGGLIFIPRELRRFSSPPGVGDVVLARWPGGASFYPARVSNVTEGGMAIQFLDGDAATVSVDELRQDTLQDEAMAEARVIGRAGWTACRISSRSGEEVSIDFGGEQIRLPLSHLRTREPAR